MTSLIVTEAACMGLRRARNKHLVDSQDSLLDYSALGKEKTKCCTKFRGFIHILGFFFGMRKEPWLFIALLRIIICTELSYKFKGNQYYTLI